MPKKGDILDEKYRLIKSIGKGGMGEIFEAEHAELGKRVAVKFLHREAAKNPTNVRRLTLEAKAAAAIGHRSIIDVYDIGTSLDDYVFLVMEFLDGESLRDRLKRKGELDIPTAAYIVCQVLSALDAAHEKNIIHRDLKPDNIYLVRAGQVLPDVKLLDFGISKIIDGSCAEDRLTKTGDIVGTPYYMAPEQAKGEKHVDQRCDIYSMGAILYECLTGRGPFVAENIVELVYKLLQEPIVPPSQLRPDIPREFEELIMKALSRDPEERFATASEMFERLLPFAGEQGASRITHPGSWSQEEKSPEPSKGSYDSSAIVTVEEELSTPAPPLKTDPTLEEIEDGKKRRRTTTIGGAIALAGVAVVVGLFFWPGFTGQSLTGGTPDGPGATTAISTTTDAGGDRSTGQGTDEEVVTITLNDVPDGAIVFLDGVRVDRNVLRRPRDPVLVEVRVEVSGDGEWRRMVSFDEDASISVELEPIDEGLAESDASPPIKAQGATARTNQDRNRPSKTKQPPGRDTTKEPEGRPGLTVETQFPGRKGGKGGDEVPEREKQ